MNPTLRAALTRLGQIAVTFVLFAICNRLAFSFEVQKGVSILFPATAVAILACMTFGPWAAIGIILATVVTPWGAEADLPTLTVSGIISALEGLIPWAVFRWRRDLHRDLRDMKSMVAFLLSGCVVNTAFSAILGNIVVIKHPTLHLDWSEIFVWFIADFVAAVLLAMPVLAFGGSLLHSRDPEPRKLANALQILAVVVLLGWSAAFIIRTYLTSSVENAQVRQQHDATQAETIINQMHNRITLVAGMVDGVVLLILVLAAITLLVNVSRPLAQLRQAISNMRDGHPFEASRIDSGYVEFRALAETIEETGRALKTREEELRLQTERALAASKHKSDFLAKMSHELRTPLNSIIGFSELLMEQDDQIDVQKRLSFLENVSSSAHRLLGLINDLLDISKVEAGKMPMRFETVDLRITIANTVATTAPLFDRKRQRVEVSMPHRPMLVRADPARVEQVLLNLLSNANKFSPEGEKIEVRTAEDRNHWCIEIADRGVGISPADQQRIFNDFEQIHPTGVLSAGTGLGLALARRFVEAHGGAIEVESSAGAGAVFRVSLPRMT